MCAMDVACRGGVLSDLVVDNGFSVGVIGFVVPGVHGPAGHCGGGAPYMAGGSFEPPAICMPWERFCG